MSVMSVKSFISRIANDSEFSLMFRECDSYDKRIALANANGFEISKEELVGLKKLISDSVFSLKTEESACASWCPCTSQSC